MKFEDVELGDDLPIEQPDISLPRIKQWCAAAEQNFPRFVDHEAARAEGLPGALVPGIMSQGFLLSMIHRWAPGCTVRRVDTVFRGPLVIETSPTIRGAVTDTDEDERTAEIDLTIVSEEGRTVVIGTALVAFPD